MAPHGESFDINTFEHLLTMHPWLADYVADDGLTMGEYIVTVCKKEYDREGGTIEEPGLRILAPSA